MASKGLKLSPEKAQIALPELRYMGFIISFDKSGSPVFNTDKSKTDAITNFPTPTKYKRMQIICKSCELHLSFLAKTSRYLEAHIQTDQKKRQV